MKDFLEYFKNIKSDKVHLLEISNVKFIIREIKKYLFLSADEANFYYIAAKKYFNPNDNETYPVPPIVVEMDYMIRGLVTFGRDEFSNLSMKEFETMQLILATKNESKQKSVADIDIDVERELR